MPKKRRDLLHAARANSIMQKVSTQSWKKINDIIPYSVNISKRKRARPAWTELASRDITRRSNKGAVPMDRIIIPDCRQFGKQKKKASHRSEKLFPIKRQNKWYYQYNLTALFV